MSEDRAPDVCEPTPQGRICLADQPTNFFWARPETVGSSRTETIAMGRNELSPERMAEIVAATRMATLWLASIEAAGSA